MLLDVALDHLREDEVRHIQQVLERDAYIQNQEETRRKKLQGSIRRERIPEKRLSLKLRTGEWMSELTAPNRATQKRGSEIIRASIRKKMSTKQKTKTHDTGEKQTDSKQKQENGFIGNERVADDKLTPEREPERVIQNGQPVPTEEEKTSDQTAEISPYKSPLRKTSIRRKKLSSSTDKQVKFDTEKTKQFVYVQTNVVTDEQSNAFQDVPSIVIDDGDRNIKTKKCDDVVTQAEKDQTSDASSYDSSVYSTGSTFESYHNAFAKDIYKSEDKDDEKATIVTKSETTPATVSSKVKKVRVVKRKGSSRRKPGPKLTDDDSRNTLFNMPDADTQAEENKVAGVISDEIIAAATKDAAIPKVVKIQDTESEADIKKKTAAVDELAYTITHDSAADEVAAELLKMVNKHISPKKEPYNAPKTDHENIVKNVADDKSKITEDLVKEEAIEVTLERIEPDISLDDIGKKTYVQKSSPKQEGSPNQMSTVSGLSDEIMKEYEKMTTVHDENAPPQYDDVIKVELKPEIISNNKSPEQFDVDPMSTTSSVYDKDAALGEYKSLVSAYESEIKTEDSESHETPEKMLPVTTTTVYEQDQEDDDSIPDLVTSYQTNDEVKVANDYETTEVSTADTYVPSSNLEEDPRLEKQEPVAETNDFDKQALSDTNAFALMSDVSHTKDTNQIDQEYKSHSADPVADKDETIPNLEEVNNKTEDVTAEYIADIITDSAASALVNEQKNEGESPTKTDKSKKKVVKKVIKKKKITEAEEQSPSKSEPQQENETPDDAPTDNTRLQRTKTIRKKVVKRKPPPTQ